MVSASHNPARDNGLKVVDERGVKLDDPVEDELEAIIFRADELAGPDNSGLGREIDATDDLEDYVRDRLAIAARCPSDAKVVIDCANGSAGAVAPRILAGTGATVDARFNEPDGMNINLDCGATAPQALARIVSETGADIGFALDGDADRCVAIDEAGNVVDGDQLIGIIALDRLGAGALGNGILVASVLSNGGLEEAVDGAPVDRWRARPSATSTSSTACWSWTPSWAARRAATSSSASTPSPATASSPRSRCWRSSPGPASDFPSWPRRSRSSRSSNAPSPYVTRTSGRQIRPLPERSRRRGGRSLGAAESSSDRRARSRRCGSWSRARARSTSPRSPTSSRRSQASD